MYNKEAILIPATSICEDVRGAIAFESTFELSSKRICWKSNYIFDKVILEILLLIIELNVNPTVLYCLSNS